MAAERFTATEEAVVRIWTAILGVTPTSGDADFFDLGGQVLALFPRSALAEDAGATEAGADAGITMALARNVGTESEVQALLDRAVAAGGRITRTPSTPPWGGVRGYFADPDGFAWEVAWNPGMQVDDDGRVRFTDA